ncbi:hypothetical protein HELRODRAFT_146854, partial [Helobdella robusta]|uniref:Ig-like domain-containing protein n=1 Tax=Helobdella robusta TaxID=6412 RepID=T1EJV1_HELRO
PEIIEHPENQYVTVNKPASLNCRTSGNPQPNVTWYKNGQPVISSNEDSQSNTMILPSGQLFFMKV